MQESLASNVGQEDITFGCKLATTSAHMSA